MVVEVIIQNKTSSKDINILDIIQDGMRYGTFDDSFRLKENDLNCPIAVFDSQNICRGHEVSINNGTIFLSLTLPTNENDIIFFYHHIKIICKMMETDEFIRDGERVALDSINNCIELDKTASINALLDMKTKICNGEYDNMYIFGAINPVAFGRNQMELIDCDLQKFGNYMNQLQSLDAYYAKPHFYRQHDSTLFGAYILSTNTTSIFPQNPKPLFIKLTVEHYYVGFVEDDQMRGFISYNDFINNVDQSKEYDASHFIITLNQMDIEKLLEKFKTEP